jgi:hypothetical protein
MQISNENIDKELDKRKKPETEQIPIIAAAKGVRDAARAAQDANSGGQGSIWIKDDDIDLVPSWIPSLSVRIATLEDEKEMVLIDTMVCNSAASPIKTLKEVRNMVRILAEVDPSTFGLLKCRGGIKVPTASSFPSKPQWDFKLIFNVPSQLSQPQSLRAVLLSETSAWS